MDVEKSDIEKLYMIRDKLQIEHLVGFAKMTGEVIKHLEAQQRRTLVIEITESGFSIVNTDNSSLLDEPVCKTCGGSGKKDPKVIYGDTVSRLDEKGLLSEPVSNRCPACQQPPAGNKILVTQLCPVCKDFTKRIESYLEATETVGWDSFEAFGGLLRDCKTYISSLESQLAKRGEAIKYLIRFGRVSRIKRILGDEEFERIVK